SRLPPAPQSIFRISHPCLDNEFLDRRTIARFRHAGRLPRAQWLFLGPSSLRATASPGAGTRTSRALSVHVERLSASVPEHHLPCGVAFECDTAAGYITVKCVMGRYQRLTHT